MTIRAMLSHTLLCLTTCLALALTGQAMAINYNISETVSHGRWQSLVLSLGEERYIRAFDDSSYTDSTLSLNVSTKACQQPWLELRVELPEHQPESTRLNQVPADVRIDHQTIHSGDATFITERGNNGFYVRFALPELALLLDEMATGKLLRLRIMRAENDPWFMAFGLEGAGPAFERTTQLCERYSNPSSPANSH